LINEDFLIQKMQRRVETYRGVVIRWSIQANKEGRAIIGPAYLIMVEYQVGILFFTERNDLFICVVNFIFIEQ